VRRGKPLFVGDFISFASADSLHGAAQLLVKGLSRGRVGAKAIQLTLGTLLRSYRT
jgi:hypothetical protein